MARSSGSRDLRAELAAPQLHRSREELGRQDEAAGQQFAVEEDAQPVGLAHHREPVVEGLLGLAVLPVGLGQHVRRGALVDVHVGGRLGDLRHELDRAGPGAHDGHTLAGEVGAVVPARGVPGGSGEIAAARDVRQGGPVELPDRGDHGTRLDGVAVAEGEVPQGTALVEPARGDARTEAQMRAETVLLGQVTQVGQDLPLRGEAAAPAPRPERKRVQVRGHVTGGTGIGVVPPGSPGPVALVDDEEVFDARPPQGDAHADPAEPGTDDDHAVRRIPGHRPSSRVARPRRALPGYQARRGPGTGRITEMPEPPGSAGYRPRPGRGHAPATVTPGERSPPSHGHRPATGSLGWGER